MILRLTQKIKLAVLLLCFPFTLFASDKDAPTGTFSITAKTGISYLQGEIHTDFSGSVSDFDNKPGAAGGFEIAYAFSQSFEAGVGLTIATLKGYTAAIEETSAATQQHVIKDGITGPVWYQNKLSGPQFFVRYYLREINSGQGSLNMFFTGGLGYLRYNGELYNYMEEEKNIFFGKGIEQYANLHNAYVLAGTGLSYAISEQVHLKLASDFHIVRYDFLDMVHNFEGEARREVFGVVPNITLGLTVRFGKLIEKRGRGTNSPHLPFAP
ncbi:MAG TPA: hypothetical protein VFD91_12930 [Mariniphaga sp.]|nr:hypothetical protein [Mariniphaga sp.]